MVLLACVLSFRSGCLAAEADAGRDLYLKYCGACHGADGKGGGPVTPALKVKVPDLTVLKKNNRGVFPDAKIMSAIDGSRKVRAHGDSDMPVWGEVFRQELKEEKYRELTTLLKTKVITDHIATLQR
jgi:mono/diheme cytochrome c family protein